ncbi:TPA: hypothetical protein I8V91_002114 [Corynebacterium striatum]|nr:hypothetical protein [Corynebacterium striatum]HAT1254315.1 hypothetical protein [Corynebacterium striatum]HAT1266558.1 hypothetical protein [Corynebacterium striatum]HAT1318918.1 hypothetical protein [Corynebacterium striatum]HAT1438100.1 hypothetical protein [Corynebacterium striatum]
MKNYTPFINFEHPDWQDTMTHDDIHTADKPIAVESLYLKWGREEYLEEHTPTTADFRLFVLDSAAYTTGLFMALRQSIPITINVSGHIIFRGYPREVKARRTTLNGRDLYEFTVNAADVTTGLEHHRPMVASGWQSTSMVTAAEQIIKRLRSLPRITESVSTVEVPPESAKTAVQIAHPDWDTVTLRTYLERFYRTLGGRGWDYNADSRTIFPQNLGPSVIRSHLAHYPHGLVIEADTDYLRTTHDVVKLDGDVLEVDELGFTIGPPMNLQKVDVKAYAYTKHDKVEKSVTVYTDGADSMTADTMLAPFSTADKGYIQRYAYSVADTVKRVTQYPLPPRVTFEFDELSTEVEKLYWLSTWDTGIIGVMTNSAVLQWLQSVPKVASADTVPPTVMPVGGELEYNGERWRVTHNIIHIGRIGSGEGDVTYETLNSGGYTIGDYAERTTWSDFSILDPNNSFKEYA